MTEKRRHPILLVDDEPEILYSLKSLLRREFELHTAESAREALEILEKNSIHVIMTDQRMPEMTGIELVGRVKLQYPEAIRIVFTGYADIKAVVEAINEGGLYRYITKPWDPDELIKVLHEAAAAYDQLVERRQLLRGLAHIELEQQWVQRAAKQENGGSLDLAEAEPFAQTGRSLLSRLDVAMED